MSAVDFDGRNQIVGKVLGRDVTRGELSIAFDAVADKANWKNPIKAVVDLDDYTKAMVAEAVVFFTGSVAKFKRLGGTTTSGIGRYRVTAPVITGRSARDFGGRPSRAAFCFVRPIAPRGLRDLFARGVATLPTGT